MILTRTIFSINKELETYNLRLMERPQIIVANKMDMPGAEENLKEFKEKLATNYDEFDEFHQFSQFKFDSPRFGTSLGSYCRST